MSGKKLTLLGIVAVLISILAVMQSRISNKPQAGAVGVAYLIQGLDPGDITSIVIGTGDEATTLNRQGKGFVVANKDNYPTVNKEINKLITSCLDIQTTELYTNDPYNHKDLEVTEQNAGTVVKFAGADSKLLTGIIVGKSKEQGSGNYVRRMGDDNVYVVRKTPRIKNKPTDYINQKITSVNRADIELVTVTSSNEVYTLKTDEDDNFIVIPNIGEGKKLKKSEADSVFGALSYLNFEDVKSRARASKDLVFDRKYSCKLKNSTVYTIQIAQKEGKFYTSCDAEFTDKTPITKKQGIAESQEELKKKEAKLLAQDKAKEFSATHKNWVYQIPEHKAKNLTKPLSNLLEAEQKAEPAEQANESNMPKEGE